MVCVPEVMRFAGIVNSMAPPGTTIISAPSSLYPICESLSDDQIVNTATALLVSAGGVARSVRVGFSVSTTSIVEVYVTVFQATSDTVKVNG